MGVVSLLAAADEGVVDEWFTNPNFPGIVLVSASGVVGMIFVLRWMHRFQKDFANYYMEENQKLRAELAEVRTELRSKEDQLTEQARAIHALETTVADLQAAINKGEK